jgi:hypothetical protein
MLRDYLEGFGWLSFYFSLKNRTMFPCMQCYGVSP